MKAGWAMITCEQQMIALKNSNEVNIHKIGFDNIYSSYNFSVYSITEYNRKGQICSHLLSLRRMI